MAAPDTASTLNSAVATGVGVTPIGKFYGMARNGAGFIQNLLPHKTCIGSDGKSLNVYNGAGQWVAAFLTPTHEYATADIGKKDYLGALGDMFGLRGQLKNIQEQRAGCQTVYLTPSDAASLPGLGDVPKSNVSKTDLALHEQANLTYVVGGTIVLAAALLTLIIVLNKKKSEG